MCEKNDNLYIYCIPINDKMIYKIYFKKKDN